MKSDFDVNSPARKLKGDALAHCPGNGQRRCILIAEDHDDTRELLRTFFELEGFIVIEAVDGQSAIDLALGKEPDLILIDLTLPIVDGISATREIRRNRLVSPVPIIFLSGRAEPIRRNEAVEAGCNDYLIKPINLFEMLTVVRHWLPEAGVNPTKV